MIRISYFIALLFVLTSCSKKDEIPPGILKPEKMQVVLWDIISADAFTAGFISRDSAKNAAAENLKLQQEIFAIHKITKTEFYDSYGYYRSNTALFKTVLDSMISKKRQEKTYSIKTLQAE